MYDKPYPYYNVIWADNFKGFLELCCKQHKNKIAFEFERDKKIISKTFYEFTIDAKALASYFIKNNIINKKIAVLGENSYEWILSYFGIVTSKNVVVPIDKDLSIEQIKNIINDTQCETIIISNDYDDYEQLIKKEINIKTINMKNKLPKVIKEGKSIYYGNKNIYESNIILGDDLAAIIYTSGTTGNPKGAMLTHKGIIKNAISGMESLKMEGNTILILPLHHTYAFSGTILCVMHSGCKNYINKSLKNLNQDLLKQKPTFLLSVPLIIETFYKTVWKKAKENKKEKLLKILICISNFLLFWGIDLRRKLFKSVLDGFGGNWNMAVCGGAAIDKKYVKGFRNFGIDILVGYGITECSPFVSVNRNKYIKYGSVGPAFTCAEIKIDKRDNENEGEILVKGEMVMKGYYNKEDLTKEVMNGEYFRTGDIGYLDKDKFLYITGRKKNVIILSNGKNVYPEEVEFELLNDEGIEEVVVFSENTKIIAEIFPNKEYLDSKSIDNYKEYFSKVILKYNKRQPIYKNINDIKLRDNEFEKTTTKKIKRNYSNKQ